MKNYILTLVLSALCLLLAACGQGGSGSSGTKEAPLPDGTYAAVFKTDSSMFHINEAYKNRGLLTVKDGKMTIHITLPSRNTVNLFFGTAEKAQASGAVLIEPSNDTVVYDDGMTEEVHGFDIPVPVIGEEFDCALIGTKGKWYDHKVSVSDPVPFVSEGEYTVEVTLTGGTGKASVESPAKLVSKNFTLWAEIVWSSAHYEYMLVDGVQYDRLEGDGNSVMRIPVVLDKDMKVSALTTAMSEPHLIEYTLHFDSAGIKAK